VPEVAGSIAIASVAAAGALAGGASWELAVGAWLVLGARVASSIPHVRAQVARLHGRRYAATPGLVGDAGAVVLAAIGVLLEPALVLGAAAIVGLVVAQRITLIRPPRPARVLGVRQMVLGFAVVGATALGAWLL
jgi:energy-converting hydrogenase Eha subunit B